VKIKYILKYKKIIKLRFITSNINKWDISCSKFSTFKTCTFKL